jgi:hypothetical protein
MEMAKFTLLCRDLIINHVEKDTLEKLEKSSSTRNVIFDMLTIGVNVVGTEVYQNIAAWLLTVPEEKLKTITFGDALKGAGDYIDETGYLV